MSAPDLYAVHAKMTFLAWKVDSKLPIEVLNRIIYHFNEESILYQFIYAREDGTLILQRSEKSAPLVDGTFVVLTHNKKLRALSDKEFHAEYAIDGAASLVELTKPEQ